MFPPKSKNPRSYIKDRSALANLLDPSFQQATLSEAMKRSANVMYMDGDPSDLRSAIEGGVEPTVKAVSPAGTLEITPTPMPAQPQPQQAIAPTAQPSFGEILGSPAVSQALIAFGRAFTEPNSPVNAIGEFGDRMAQANAERAYFNRLMAGEDPESIQGLDVAGITPDGIYRAQQAAMARKEEARREESHKTEQRYYQLNNKRLEAALSRQEILDLREDERWELTLAKEKMSVLFDRIGLSKELRDWDYTAEDRTWELGRREREKALERVTDDLNLKLLEAQVKMAEWQAKNPMAGRSSGGGTGSSAANATRLGADLREIRSQMDQTYDLIQHHKKTINDRASYVESGKAPLAIQRLYEEAVSSLPELEKQYAEQQRLYQAVQSSYEEQLRASIGKPADAAETGGAETGGEETPAPVDDNIIMQKSVLLEYIDRVAGGAKLSEDQQEEAIGAINQLEAAGEITTAEAFWYRRNILTGKPIPAQKDVSSSGTPEG